MTARSTMSIEPLVVVLRSRAKVAHHKLQEAMETSTGYIDDLPPFLYIDYALCWTAVQDLMVEYEIAAAREAPGFRLVRLWMWIPAADTEFETAVQEVDWEDPEK